VAVVWRPRSGPSGSYSYGDLDRAVSRFASGVLREGLSRGDTVAILTGRIPEFLVAVLGSLRAGAVPTVLFSSHGPDPVRRRLARARARLLVTTPRLFRDKVAALSAHLPDLHRVLVVDSPGSLAATTALDELPEGTQGFGAWLARGDDAVDDAPVGAGDPALLHFTSGTAGEPKAVLHAHEAVVAHAHTARRVLGLRKGTRFWCTADPGWVTGVSYGILGPMSLGATVFMDEEDFDAHRWWENMASQGIEVLYTSPITLRLLRFMEHAVPCEALPRLRTVLSVGEPLARTEAEWALQALGRPVHDSWWQTETGSIVLATPWDETPRSGRVGHAVDGFEVACVRRTRSGLEPVAAGERGELAVRAGWPAMFRAYLGHPKLYAHSFQDGWYLSGDVATMDEDGWVAFHGRLGDVFKSAGHVVSPAEVEEVLLAHPAIADAGVWARQDPVAGNLIEAHVVLSKGRSDGEALRREILGFARGRLGPALAPRSLRVLDRLPRTPSGKILRRELASPVPEAQAT
jgi:acetyl-CoA synthetase